MKRVEIAIVSGATVAVALLAACQTSTSNSTNLSSAGEAPPAGVWALDSFELSGGQTVTVPDPASYTLELSSDRTVQVKADCNVCKGGYELNGRSLRIGLLACTLAACPPGSLESEYLQALSSASTLDHGGAELRIAYDGGVLRFTPR